MQLKLLKAMAGPKGAHAIGAVIEADEKLAADLIKVGAAVKHRDVKAEAKAAAKEKEAAGKSKDKPADKSKE